MWERKDADIREILDGRHRLSIIAPELTPRDALENAQKAINLVQNKLWSMERAMDSTGVEDPEEEKNLIRAEQTDPALQPAAVLQQVTLAGAMQQLGVQAGGPGAPAAPAGPTNAQASNAQRTLTRPAAGGESLNAPENQGNPPPESLPENAQGGGQAMVQTLTDEQGARGRVMTSTNI
jgi:hypothetical protein